MSALQRRNALLPQAAMLLALVSAAFPVGSHAQSGESAAEPALSAELQSELDALLQPVWQVSGTAKISAGYRDNILLSAFAPEGRGFLQVQCDAIARRAARNAWEWLAFVDGTVLRYVSPLEGAEGEQQWFAHGEVRWIPSSRARAGLAVQGYYQDMVVDLSDSESARVIAPLKARGALATVSAKLLLPAHFTLEPSAQAHLSDYLDYAGDYRELREGARLEWKRWAWLALTGAWYSHQRRYRDRAEFTAGGRALPGTRLELDQREAELAALFSWNAGGRWTATAQTGRLENRDGTSGYFDYNRREARLALAWSDGPWTIEAEATAQRFDYLVQRVGIGIAPPPRVADSYDTQLRVSRKVDERWTAFVEGRWERNRSNEAEFSYRTGSGLAGIARDF